jgi:hypothetical protein
VYVVKKESLTTRFRHFTVRPAKATNGFLSKTPSDGLLMFVHLERECAYAIITISILRAKHYSFLVYR